MDAAKGFLTLVGHRYSCREFYDKQLTDEELNVILEAVRKSPSARNLQPTRICVVQSPEGLAKIDECTRCRYGAPTVLLVAFNSENVYTYPGSERTSGVEDASIVATHMILAAANEGVDSCWINRLNPDEVAVAFGLPANEVVLCAIDLGYAAEGAGPLPNHSSRKELAQTVTRL